jgi:hypothetical protein
MWETPPLIAGGTWTACYHLVRNLRRRGAHVTVVVPWDRSIILRNPFGSEVPMVVLGIVPPDDTGSAYGEATPAWSHPTAVVRQLPVTGAGRPTAEAARDSGQSMAVSAVARLTRPIAPSEATRGKLVALYRAAAGRIDVVPNVLSEGAAPTADMGRFETNASPFSAGSVARRAWTGSAT